MRVLLTAAGMGDTVTERDYDLWARYVRETLGAAVGLDEDDLEVEQAPIGEGGDDWVSGADPEVRQAVRDWLTVDGWEAFCAGAWQAMAATEDERATGRRAA